jgi:hypothetical protein
MNPPSENHSTVTDDTQDWIVEIQLGKSKLSAALRWQVDDPGDEALEIVARDEASVMMLCSVSRSAHLLIASILIVPGGRAPWGGWQLP